MWHQRVVFDEMLTADPPPADVRTTPGTLDGVPVLHIETTGVPRVDRSPPGSCAICGTV